MVRLLALCLALAAPGGALAQGDCRLALLLALDVSSSVDAQEYRLQKEGVAAALLSPDVRRAILSGQGVVALGVYEWSGRRQNSVVLDWVRLDSEAAITAAARRIGGAQRSYSRFPTAMGYALGYGAGLLARGPDCLRRVIDVSGDGVTNDGFWPTLAYRNFPFEGVTVNGLAVLGADPAVLDHYEFEVQYGPGAFVETAPGYAGYRRAMERKLFREINDIQVGGGALPLDPPG
ncbi:hypothetical protein GCM10011324_15130 [Allosediminivita pacifica]|nr:hypothetical protein GCM10011324_15130 [Allosediminivita pacifica]